MKYAFEDVVKMNVIIVSNLKSLVCIKDGEPLLTKPYYKSNAPVK